MKRTQYTLRDIPGNVDARLRARARKSSKSLNAVAIEVLAKGLGLEESAPLLYDLDELAGTWVKDPACDAALNEMRKIDKELWR